MVEKLQTLLEHKRKQKRFEMRERAEKHQKEQARIDQHKAVKRRELAKQAYRRLGKREKRAAAAASQTIDDFSL
jgi:tellurite resistance protein